MEIDNGLCVFNACLQVPFSMIVAGPSNSGKTTFVYDVLQNCDRVIEKKVDYVAWFYGQTIPSLTFSSDIDIKFIHGLP